MYIATTDTKRQQSIICRQLYLFVQEVEAKSKLVHSFTDKIASQFSVPTPDGTPHVINTALR